MGGGAAQRDRAGGIRKYVDDARPRARSGRLDEGREIVGGCLQRSLQNGAGERRRRARLAGRGRRRFLYDVSQAISAERVSERRGFPMSYSRRNFLKAAGSGVVL